MYYAGEPYDSVLQQLKALLGEPEFFVRLTGTQGSGKSTLLEQIASYYAEQGYLTRYFPSNPDSPMALRSALRKSFGLEKSHNFQRNLQEHLTTEARLYKGIVLIFDDCHLMNNATLLELTKLTDIQINHSCMLSIIMGGSEKLDDRLKRDHELRPVLQRITLSTYLPAMDKKDSALFIRKFFDDADQQELGLDAPALALLHSVSKGLPQYISEIASLCSNLYRSNELSSPVKKSDLAHVLKHPSLAVRRMTRPRSAPSRRIIVPAAAAAAALTLLGTAWITILPTSPTEQTPVPPVMTNNVAIDSVSALAQDVLPPVEFDDAPAPDLVVATESVPVAVAEPVVETAAEIVAEPVVVIAADAVVEIEAEPSQTPAPASASEQALSSPEQSLQNWIAAWQARDVDAYFSFYHAEFFPRGFDSVSAWQENRRRNISNREWIEMQISELSINYIAEQTSELQFWLSYQSPGYSDRTRKQVLMRLTDEGWLITQEINLEIVY